MSSVVALGEVPFGWKSLHPPFRVGCLPCCPRKQQSKQQGRRFSSLPVWVCRWTPPAWGSPRPSERCRVLVDAGDELFTVPSPEHEGPHGGGDPVLLHLRGR